MYRCLENCARTAGRPCHRAGSIGTLKGRGILLLIERLEFS